jgi:DNA polymerase-1
VPSFQDLKVTIDDREVFTGATYGFLWSLKKMFDKYKQEGDKVIVVWDGGGKNFRHELSADYKATRAKRTPEFLYQIGLTRDFIRVLGVMQAQMPNTEADDIIGVLTIQARLKGYGVLIISSDKDFNQLVSNHVSVAHPNAGEDGDKIMTPEVIKEEYGISPSQFIDWLALQGDSSDNVAGIEGIGKKTASQLLQCNGTIEDIVSADVHYKFAKDGVTKKPVSDKLQQKISAAKDQLVLSKKLVTIKKKFDSELIVEQNTADYRQLRDMMKLYGFSTMLQKFNEFISTFS